MKIGVNIKIDVTKIDKSKLFEGKKGTYLDLTSFIDIDNKDKYDNNGFVSQSTTKEERDAGEKGAILGNVKVFFQDISANIDYKGPAVDDSLDDDIPF